MRKTIVCLANSKKPPTGRCIAGKEMIGAQIGAWIRPVSARETREINEDERRYESGGAAQLFDKIDIDFLRAQPSLHQRENYLINDQHPWHQVGRATWEEVHRLVDRRDSPLWESGISTNHGRNDKVPENNLPAIRDSLRLILIPEFTIRVYLEAGWQGAPGRRRVRGAFEHAGIGYDLSVSDPVVETEFLRRQNGQYPVGEVIACVSLADPFHGFAFKVLASISNAHRYEGRALLR